ncbi:MAG: hypothetical protein JWO06_2121 [Bacteroidota bacterium]|nr:hypothetical protein [Bacteroidota bacterium]
MTKLLMVVFSCFGTLLLSAQNANISWGPIGDVGALMNSAFISATGDNCYYILTTYKNPKITKFDTQHTKIGEKEMDATYKGQKIGGFKGMQVKHFIHTKNYEYLTFQAYNMKDKTIELVFSKLNKDLGLSEPKLVASSQFNMPTLGEIFDASDRTGVTEERIRTNKSRTLLVHIHSQDKDKPMENYAITVFDETLNVKWKKQQSVPYPAEKTSIQSVQLSEDGQTVIISARVYDASKIFVITQNDFKEIKFDLGYHADILNGSAFVKPDGSLVIAGAYVDNNDPKLRISGTYALSFDTKEMKASKPVLFPFKNNVLDKLPGDDGNSIEGLHYRLANLLLSEAGTVTLIINRTYNTVKYYSNGTTISEPHCNERIVVGIDNTLHKKYDLVVNDEFKGNMASPVLSSADQIGEKTIFIYSAGDYPKNEYHVGVISEDGELKSFDAGYDQNLNKTIWELRDCGKPSPNSILVEGRSGKRYKHGILSVGH